MTHQARGRKPRKANTETCVRHLKYYLHLQSRLNICLVHLLPILTINVGASIYCSFDGRMVDVSETSLDRGCLVTRLDRGCHAVRHESVLHSPGLNVVGNRRAALGGRQEKKGTVRVTRIFLRKLFRILIFLRTFVRNSSEYSSRIRMRTDTGWADVFRMV